MELEAQSLKVLIDQRNGWLNDGFNRTNVAYEKVSVDTRQMEANHDAIINKIKDQQDGESKL